MHVIVEAAISSLEFQAMSAFLHYEVESRLQAGVLIASYDTRDAI